MLESHHDFIFVGDLNINVLKINADTNNYLDTLASNRYDFLNFNHSNYFTFSGPNGFSLLDHVFSDIQNRRFNIHIGDVAFSDHRFLRIDVSSRLHSSSDEFEIIKTDFSGFEAELRSRLERGTDTGFESFLLLFSSLLRLFQTVKKVERSNKTDMPWFCPEIQMAIEERNYWHKRKRDFPDNEFVIARFKEMHSLVTNLVRFHKKRYYTSAVNANINNLKKLWQIFNELIYSRTRNAISGISKIYDSFNNLITGDLEMSEVFNDYYVNIADGLRSALFQANSGRSIMSTMHYTCPSSILVSETDEEEVHRVIGSLNDGSSSGMDGISVKLIKFCMSSILSVIVMTFNDSLRSCIFPCSLKISKTIPIYKSGVKSQVSNYRPISVLSNFAKIFEKLIYVRLESFYSSTNFFHSHQFGFVSKSNTSAAVLNFITFLRGSLNSRKYTSAIFIDMSKAFDCVVHDILLEKLYKSGIRGNFHQLLSSYLSGRTQSVRIGKSTSSAKEVRYSVPQGSILGPLLFLVYINDIFELKLRGTLQLYADDVILMYSKDSVVDLYDDMQHDLNLINEWFYNNCLTVNPDKTNFMIFRDPRRVINYNRPLFLGGNMIKLVSEVKYLGMIFDSALNFHSHLDKLKKKIISFVAVLGRLKNYVPVSSRLSIYYAHIHSHISYLNVIWSSASAYKLLEISRLQNKAIRAVFFEEYKKPNIHTIDLYRNHNLLNLFQMNKYETVLLVYKLKNNLLRHNLTLTTNDEIHEHDTRNRRNFHIGLNVNNNYGKFSIMHQGLILYNDLPPNMRVINSFEIFKKKLKIYAFSHYSTSSD
jgi:hypothetical protein